MIPAAVLVDWLLQGFLLQVAAAVGVVLIITGFIGFVVSEIVALKTKGKVGISFHVSWAIYKILG